MGFKKLNAMCESIEKIIVSYSILTMALVAILNVIGRNFFKTSFSWAEEVTQFSVVLVTFVGTAYAARTGAHIRMSALSDALGHKGKKIVAVVVALGTALFMGYMTYYSVLYVKGLYAMKKYTLGLQIPVYIIMAWVPVGFAFATLQYLITLYKNVTCPEVFIAPDVLEGQGGEGWEIEEGEEKCC